MKNFTCLSALAVALSVGAPLAQARAAPAGSGPPNLSCKAYLAMDEAAKPEFIQGAAQRAPAATKVTSIIVDKLGVEERLKPELDRYCKLNVDKSASEHVMKSSMALQKTQK